MKTNTTSSQILRCKTEIQAKSSIRINEKSNKRISGGKRELQKCTRTLGFPRGLEHEEEGNRFSSRLGKNGEELHESSPKI